jgi:hypothetical protein
MVSIYKQPIYLVVQGASCNDIVSSVQEEFPKLDELGIREMFVIRDTADLKNKIGIDNPSSIYPKILTSLDVPAIESAFILYYSASENVEIQPVPYLSDKTSLKNENAFGRFREMFQGGDYKKYWHGQELASNLTTNSIGINSLKSKVPPISWKYTQKKIGYKTPNGREITMNMNSSGLRSFQFETFKKKVLFPTIMENIQNRTSNNTVSFSDGSGKGISLKPIVIVCNYKTVLQMINEVKNRKFKEGVDTIERGSIWEIEIKYEHGYESSDMINRYHFIHRSKVFPTDLSIKGTAVTYNKNTMQYSFKMKGKNVPMGLANKPVSQKTAITLECKFCKREKELKNSLKKIYEEMPQENKEKVVNQTSNQGTKKNIATSNITSLGSAVKAFTKMPVF